MAEFIIYDSVSNKRVRTWKAGKGLTTPEYAEPDADARYSINLSLPSLPTAVLEKLMQSPRVQRAAAWYDSTVPQQNERFAAMDNLIRYTLSDKTPDLPAFYDLRIPTHYKPDGSWGLVIYRDTIAYDEFFPILLRETCNDLKLVFATIKPDVGIGQWHEFTLMVSLLNILHADFRTDVNRTIVIGDRYGGTAAAFLGSLYPERVRHTITRDVIVSPYDTGARFRIVPMHFGSIHMDNMAELGFLAKEDWKSPDLAQTKWAYGMTRVNDLEALRADIIPLWKDIGQEYKLMDISGPFSPYSDNWLPSMLRAALEAN